MSRASCAAFVRWLILFSALLVSGAAFAADGAAGRYRLVGEQDVASELLLHADGRFQYFLIAGALDEQAEGRWTREGRTLRLVNAREPVPPAFSLEEEGRAAESPFSLQVRWPDGRGIAGVDFQLGFDSGEPLSAYTQEDGWTLPEEEKRIPRWIELAVPMHQVASPRFEINVAKANRLTFLLDPNDMGVVDFSAVPVELEGAEILVHRFGQKLTYRRED